METEKKEIIQKRDFFKRFENLAEKTECVAEIDLSPVIKSIENAVFAVNPKLRYPVGKGARVITVIYNILPINLQFQMRKFTSLMKN